jgi:Gas vesicle protein
MRQRQGLVRTETSNLADVLERVLDKGIVIAGDISIRLVDIELLTIQVRLVITSVDRARELGMDWWVRDFGRGSGQRDRQAELADLKRRIAELEQGAGAIDDDVTETALLPAAADQSKGRPT